MTEQRITGGHTVRTAPAAIIVVALLAAPHGARAEDAFRPAIAVTPEGLTCVLGGNLDGQLVDSTIVTPLMTHKQEYSLITLNGVKDVAWAIGRPREDDPSGGCEGMFQQELSIGPAQTGNYMVAVRGSKDEVRALLPKDLEILPPDSPEYGKILRDFLTEAGIVDPKMSVAQLIRVDLDGDGEQDVLINAVNTARENTKKDEYSVVLVRRKTAAGAKNLEIAAEVITEDADEPSPLWENTVAAILDLDGDGTMEVVLYGAFIHGDGWQVVHINGNEVEQVMVCGCGG